MSEHYCAAVVGITGYTGSELLRLLQGHPDVSITMVTSESQAGKNLRDHYPHFHDCPDLTISSLHDVPDHDPDVVFLALPHGVSMDFVSEYGGQCRRIIDLSGDFRLGDRETYEHWYEMEHRCPEQIKNATYGMPELYRDTIRESSLIANPGCFPTSVIIPLVPLLREKIIDPLSIIADAKTGVSGAGATPKAGTHFPDVFGNFTAYKLKHHRHTPEMEYILSGSTGSTPSILFTPHLLPVDRGILATLYTDSLRETTDKELRELFSDFYDSEPFVRYTDTPPAIKDVRGSNYIDIHAAFDTRTGRIIVLAAIDNLVKGAAGAAVQNMNIMLETDETHGLMAFPLNP